MSLEQKQKEESIIRKKRNNDSTKLIYITKK